MSDPYLDTLERAMVSIRLRQEAVTLMAIALECDLPVDVVRKTFDNGVLKGFWKIRLTGAEWSDE